MACRALRQAVCHDAANHTIGAIAVLSPSTCRQMAALRETQAQSAIFNLAHNPASLAALVILAKILPLRTFIRSPTCSCQRLALVHLRLISAVASR